MTSSDLRLSKLMLIAFFLMVIIQPQFLQAVEVQELNTVNKTQTASGHLRHKSRHGVHKHHKQLLQTGAKSDSEDDTVDDDDDDDTVSIEQVDDDNKTASVAQANNNEQSNQQNNKSADVDTRLVKKNDTSFFHLSKFQNLRVAFGDALKDQLSYI